MMKIKNEFWTIDKFHRLRNQINLSPIFQRGPVWGVAAQQLLMDSILRDFDIPKIYLWKTSGQGHHLFKVTDGQQRLTAIWGFIDNEFSLGKESDSLSWPRAMFRDLPPEAREKIESYELVTAVITRSSSNEVRELFVRLQRGMQLKPAEIRNAIPSQLGDLIRTAARNHGFFSNTLGYFSSESKRSRYKPDDWLAHAVLLELFGDAKDLKAPDLRAMYEEFREGVDSGVMRKVYKVLDFMDEMQAAWPKCIKTKWGFVDLYWLISQSDGLPPPPELAGRYVDFERERLRHVSRPEVLLSAQDGQSADSGLYEYIQAFRSQGALKRNVRVRHEILLQRLLGA